MPNLKTILSLFDYSGNWSQPYRESGYNVIQVDIKHGIDVFEVMEWFITGKIKRGLQIYGILAAPPCTDFTVSSAWCWDSKLTKPAEYESDITSLRFDNSLDLSLGLVYATIEIITQARPKFWALENPVGRLGKLIPELGTPWYFQPYWYGDPYSKKTGLFGQFNKPLKSLSIGLFDDGSSDLKEVDSIFYTSKSGRKYAPQMWNCGGGTERTKTIRSVTPMGFSKAFFNANQ